MFVLKWAVKGSAHIDDRTFVYSRPTKFGKIINKQEYAVI